MDAALLAAACDAQPGDRVLDLGCGPGAVMLAAAVRRPGARFTGIEADPQALDLARAEPQRQVVFLAVGFETTAPATALLAHQAQAWGLANLSVLVAHVRVTPAMDAILVGGDDPADPGVQGFLAAGHVAAVLGTARDAEVLAERYTRALDELPAELVRGPVHERLVEGARRRYQAGLRRSLTAMRSARYFRMLDALDGLVVMRARHQHPHRQSAALTRVHQRTDTTGQRHGQIEPKLPHSFGGEAKNPTQNEGERGDEGQRLKYRPHPAEARLGVA
jgi:precorrin-6B methylase 2